MFLRFQGGRFGGHADAAGRPGCGCQAAAAAVDVKDFEAVKKVVEWSYERLREEFPATKETIYGSEGER